MKKWNVVILAILMIGFLLPPAEAKADTGPKPSVVVEFVGLQGENYYVTLLSQTESTGPWRHEKEYMDYMGPEEIYNRFNAYEDTDGYYFISLMEDCTESQTFSWTYYPPQQFKILLYFPEMDSFLAVPGSYERYAFDSYFTVSISGVEQWKTSKDASLLSIEVESSYDYAPEMISLALRVVITIVVEFVLALLFFYRDKRSFLVISLSNVVTQLGLNILLNLINYKNGPMTFVLRYLGLELIVLVLEAIIYRQLLEKQDASGRKRHPILYALVANALSFAVGLAIARLVPGIF